MIYNKTDNYILYFGKMQDELKKLEDNSVDSVICDPPYDLTSGNTNKGFMGKTWDGTGVAFEIDTWKQVLRVLKPGGYLLAFGGTRTFHRMACAIEDAGFEIRDTIMWLYGSGFPKSHNVGLDIDKINGVDNKTGNIVKTSKSGGLGLISDDSRKPHDYEERTAQNEYAGYGTALKPAYEPIIMARKPFSGSAAQNILKYGVGAINIDGCRANGRFPANVITDGSDEVAVGMPNTKSEGGCSMKTSMFGLTQQIEDYNFHDSGSAMRYFYSAKASKKDRDEGLDEFEEHYVTDGCERSNFETAHKFGCTSSAPRKNPHPTVKPTELMQYLIRLVSPPGSTILDPFMGSGSTGKAAMFENSEHNSNYKFIGIEMTEEYLPIANTRIDYALHKYEYEIKIEKEGTLFDFI